MSTLASLEYDYEYNLYIAIALATATNLPVVMEGTKNVLLVRFLFAMYIKQGTKLLIVCL